MRQVLVNSKGALIARMPRPVVDEHSVLIRVHYSAISVGTEVAPLKAAVPTSTDVSGAEKAKAYSNLARTYLGAAIRDPRKAMQRITEIGGRLTWQLGSAASPVAGAELDMRDLSWERCEAAELELDESELRLTTDDSDAAYQAISKVVKIEPGIVPVVTLRGEVLEGAVSIGLLDGDRKRWLGSRTYDTGRFEDDLIFKTDGAKGIVIVVANCGAGHPARLTLEDISVKMRPASGDGAPHSDLDDQGWNAGYSASGEVIAAGSKVHGFVPGDRVACGGAGKANHAGYVSVPQNLVCRIPDGCDMRDAATATIGTIAMQGVRRAAPQLGDKVCVIGLGLLGQLAVQLLHASGCEVVGLDRSQARVQRAKALGMEQGASDAETCKALVRDLTGDRGVDRTVIAAATKSDSVINLAMDVTRAKGTVVIVGDVGLNIQRSAFYRKEIDLLMSRSYGPGRYDREYEELGQDYPYSYVRWTLNRNMEAYMRLVASGRLQILPLIDQVVPVDEAEEVYRELVQSAEPPLGVLFEYPRDEGEPEADTRIVIGGHRRHADKTIAYALVGAGAFGLSMLVPQMQRRKDLFFLRGIASRSGLQASNFARSNRVELLTTNIEDILAEPAIDLVVIATRHNHHAEQVVAALRAGKHVFVEKPLALSWPELDLIARTRNSLEEPPLLMVGFNRRFSPAVEAVLPRLRERRSPLMINYRVNAGYIPPDHWVQTEEGGGRNLGEACHMYDVFRCLTGASVADINATAIDPAALPRLRTDNFCATLRYADGSVANLVYTSLGPKQGVPKERLEIFCDGELFLVDDYRSVLKCSDGEVLWSSKVADKGHFNELGLFGEAIMKGREDPIPFDDLVETSAVALYVDDILRGVAGND